MRQNRSNGLRAWGGGTLVIGLLGLCASVGAQTITQMVSVSGDVAPDGNGAFDFHQEVVLNDAGQVAFRSTLDGTFGGFQVDDSGVFRGAALGSPQLLARRGNAVPGGNGTFSITGVPSINNNGLASFTSSVSGTAGGLNDNSGVYLATPSVRIEIARKGDGAPDGNGTYNVLAQPVVNNSNQVAYFASYRNTNDGLDDNSSIVVADVIDNLVTARRLVAREGFGVPGGNGDFASFAVENPINDAGQVAFRADLRNTGGGTADNAGLYRGTGIGGPVAIARKGANAPEGNGLFSGFGFFQINNAGQVAFGATLSGTAGGFADGQGVYLGDGSASPINILRKGDTSPGGTSTVQSSGAPSLNDAGQIVLRVDLASGGSELVRYESGGGFTQILSAGSGVPGGNGNFGFLTDQALNNAGQAAFMANLTGTDGGNADNQGLFLADDTLGIQTVARKGDAYLGSTITNLEFTDGRITGQANSGLNDLGQVAYRFGLADGRSGVALWSLLTTLTGDYSGDGFVSQSDLDLVLLNWGDTALPVGFDPTAISSGAFDGLISQNELDAVLLNWGDGTSPSVAALPEPGALAAVLLGLPALAGRRRAA